MYTLLYVKWITNKDLQETLLTVMWQPGWEGSLGENSSNGRESACSVGDPGLIPSLGEENPLEKGMATHSSILAWRIAWTEEPGGLRSMGSQRLGHD